METDAATRAQAIASGEALLAGTLALMTGQAQASCQEARCQMTHRICINLAELGQHRALNPNFRAAVRQLHGHWCRLDAELSCHSEGRPGAVDPFHIPSPTLQ